MVAEGERKMRRSDKWNGRIDQSVPEIERRETAKGRRPKRRDEKVWQV